MKLCVFVGLLLLFGCTNTKHKPFDGYQLSGQSAPLDMVFIPGQGKIPSFYVGQSEEPNINYVAYLNWLRNVFIDYPEVHIDAKIKFNKGSTATRFNDPSLVYHMEHPAFAYYPVVGATWHQIQQYMMWKTDRLNEDILIQTEILKEDYNQINEENFNTESFLYGQYLGAVNKPLQDPSNPKMTRSVNWEDGILFAGYRLPTEAEWELLQDESNDNVANTNFPYGKKYPYLKWLRPMFGYYDELDGVADYHTYWKSNKALQVDLDNYKKGIQGPYLSNKPSNVAGNVKEWLMDVYYDSAVNDWDNMAEYFYKVGFETRSERHAGVYDMDGIIDLKDSLGRLRFRILGINSDGSPLWSLHPRKRSTFQLKGYDTIRNPINPTEYYLESDLDSFYKTYKKGLRNTYLYYKNYNVGNHMVYDLEALSLTQLMQNVTRYGHVFANYVVPSAYDLDAVDREVYHWVKRLWNNDMKHGYCAINVIDFTKYYCGDSGMYTIDLIPMYDTVSNNLHLQNKLIRGGTWESPNHANREYLRADSGRSDVGFRVVLPYTNMPVKEKYKVKWN